MKYVKKQKQSDLSTPTNVVGTRPAPARYDRACRLVNTVAPGPADDLQRAQGQQIEEKLESETDLNEFAYQSEIPSEIIAFWQEVDRDLEQAASARSLQG